MIQSFMEYLCLSETNNRVNYTEDVNFELEHIDLEFTDFVECLGEAVTEDDLQTFMSSSCEDDQCDQFTVQDLTSYVGEEFSEIAEEQITTDEFVSLIAEEFSDLSEAQKLLPNEKRITVQVGPGQKKSVIVDRTTGQVTRGILKGKQFDINRAAKKAAMKKIRDAERIAQHKEEDKEFNAIKNAQLLRLRALEARRSKDIAQGKRSYPAQFKNRRDAAKDRIAAMKEKEYKLRWDIEHDQPSKDDAQMTVKMSKSKNIKDRLQAYKERKARQQQVKNDKAQIRNDLAAAKKIIANK